MRPLIRLRSPVHPHQNHEYVMYVCMYMYVYVCVYIYIYTHVCAYMGWGNTEKPEEHWPKIPPTRRLTNPRFSKLSPGILLA